MTKAEEYSFNIGSELYNHLAPEQQKLWRKDIEDAWDNAYCEAEKDLALTWEDFERIDDIFIAIRLDGIDKIKNMTNKEFYQKVLDRFNKQKNELRNVQ